MTLPVNYWAGLSARSLKGGANGLTAVSSNYFAPCKGVNPQRWEPRPASVNHNDRFHTLLREFSNHLGKVGCLI